ncbi:glycosyltransferase family 87 protein [Acrocarpospora catenulata]|uniref:glycosyltransferase family 87 protein n=1 Tax=Acrocarpospora catenulata TaxID=2836182 RepID=UPI003558B1D4
MWIVAILLTLAVTVWYAFRDSFQAAIPPAQGVVPQRWFRDGSEGASPPSQADVPSVPAVPGQAANIPNSSAVPGQPGVPSAPAVPGQPGIPSAPTISGQASVPRSSAVPGRGFRDGLRHAALSVPAFFLRRGGQGSAAWDERGWGRGFGVPLVFGLVVVACLYLMPIRDQIRFGQVDLFLVALCLLDSVVRRPWWPRGMLIGIATAVKLTPGVFLIYLAITAWRDPDQRRPFWTAVGTAAVLTLIPFAAIPQDATDFWFGALLDSERLGANTGTTNQSIRAMLLRLYWPDSVTTALWLAAVAAVGWYGFRAARRAYDEGDVPTAIALTGLMAVLLSPVAWIHHLAWILLVLAALARTRALLAAGVWLYYVIPIPWWGAYIKGWEIPVLSPTLGKIVQNAFGLGALALVCLLANQRPRNQHPPHGSPSHQGPSQEGPGREGPDRESSARQGSADQRPVDPHPAHQQPA